MNIYTGKARAGISEVGNELENVKFYGGDYGIIAGQTSPSWPVAMVDTYFEGQQKAAIQCHNTGFAIVNMNARNVPVAVEIRENDIDRLFMEDCIFDNVKEAAVVISREQHALTQVNLMNIVCRNVPVLTHMRQSGEKIMPGMKMYRVKDFTYGLVMKDMETSSEYMTIKDFEALDAFPASAGRKIPSLPPMETWVT